MGMIRESAKWVYYKINQPMITRRRQQRNAMPSTRLEDKHLAGAQILPDRQALLDRMEKNAVVAEAGVAKGNFSKIIVELTSPRELTLIDAWHTSAYANDERLVREHFEQSGLADVVKIKKGMSTDMLASFPDNYFDWVYIDTNHAYETTRDELLIATRIVKPGGRILGHDYCLGNIVKPAVFGVIPAVNSFCVEQNWAFEYLTLETHGHFSFCLKEL